MAEPRRDLAGRVRAALAELLGTGLLVATVIGSGIAASRMSPTDVGLQLLENALVTALALFVLIAVFAPISGAYFNPVVLAVDAVLTAQRRRDVPLFVVAQLVGGALGAVLANLMFGLPAVSIATTDRMSAGTVLGEVVATAGLVLVVLLLARTGRSALIAPAVAAWIGAAYFFTSSTSFANPAVALARMLSDTFAGIAPISALAFVAAQLVGGALGLALAVLLTPRAASPVAA